MPDVPAALFDGIGTVGLVVLLGWLIAAGRLVTQREVNNLISLYVQQLEILREEKDAWRESAQTSERQVETVLLNQAAMRTQLQTAVAFIEALPKPKDDT